MSVFDEIVADFEALYHKVRDNIMDHPNRSAAMNCLQAGKDTLKAAQPILAPVSTFVSPGKDAPEGTDTATTAAADAPEVTGATDTVKPPVGADKAS